MIILLKLPRNEKVDGTIKQKLVFIHTTVRTTVRKLETLYKKLFNVSYNVMVTFCI